MKFDRVTFSVQLHDLPLMYMNEEMGAFWGESIREVQNVDFGATGEFCGKFMRIRVTIDITQPLWRWVILDEDGTRLNNVWIPLKYVRLPDFCYGCGMVDIN